FGNEGGDFVVLDLDLPRLVAMFPGDGPASLGGMQGTAIWPRPDPGKVRWEDHWTVDTLDARPARTPYRPGWTRPAPSRPSFPPGAPAPAAQKPGSPQPKTADASPPAGSGGKGADAGALPWLILGGVGAGFLVLGLAMGLRKRDRAPRAGGGAAAV